MRFDDRDSRLTRQDRVLQGLCALALLTASVVGQPVTQADVVDLQLYRTQMDRLAPEGQMEVVSLMLSDAKARLRVRQPGSDALLAQAGSWAKALGNQSLAMDCWRLMIVHPESAAGEFSARRMMGVTLARRGDASGAIRELRRALEIAEGDDALTHDYYRSLVHVVQSLSELLEERGEVDAAVRCRASLLRPVLEGVLAPEMHEWATRANASSLAKVGRTIEAGEWYDRCLATMLATGADAGRLLRLKLERARGVHESQGDYESQLISLWTDPAYAGLPEVAEVGFSLAGEYRSHGPAYNELAFYIYREIADRMIAVADNRERPESGQSVSGVLDTDRRSQQRLDASLRYVVVLGSGLGMDDEVLLAAAEYEERCGISQETEFIRSIAARAANRVQVRTLDLGSGRSPG